MLQLNLLPDIKQKFLQAKRLQRLTIFISIIVASGVAALFITLFMTVNIWQRQRINGLTKDISDSSNKLKNIEDLDRILTVQNQLAALPELHAKKPVVQRLFDYLKQVTPTTCTISSIVVDNEGMTMEISGASAYEPTRINETGLAGVNKFVDTLKFTTYKINPEDGEEAEKPAFSAVVLSTFGRDSKGATYKVNLTFDPEIFNSLNDKLTLVVPNIITTRSETEKPLFLNAEPPAEGTE